MKIREERDGMNSWCTAVADIEASPNIEQSLGVEEEFGFIPGFTRKGTATTHNWLSEAVQCTASPLSLDIPALNVFFRTGMFLNGSTPFQEIRRYCPPPQFVSSTELSRDEAIDAYIDLFRASVRKRVTPGFAMALSGGADSRHILLELMSQGHLPEYLYTVDFPHKPEEAQIAAELALRAGVRHVVQVPNHFRSVQDELWKNEQCGFMSMEHEWFAEAGRKRDSFPWWDGIAVDVLSAGLFLDQENLALFQNNRLDELAESLVSKGRVPYFRDHKLFVPEDAIKEVYAELLKHREAPNPIGSFYFWNRTRVNIASSAFGLLRPAGQETIAPYLDRELWAFLASLPAHMVLDHRFHTDAIKRAYPEFADIPYAKKQIAIDTRVYRMKAIGLMRYLTAEFLNTPRTALAFKMMRVARALIDPRRTYAVRNLLPTSVFCSQVARLSENKGATTESLSLGIRLGTS